jgi:serine/threonine protein kinase
MNTPQDTAKSIFLRAVEITSEAERAAYLESHCTGNDALRREVDDLLRHHKQVGEFLEVLAAPFAPTVHEPPSEGAGGQIGPYKLLEQIGEGGFGIVFMADQHAPVRRRVALKVIKPGMDTRQILTRFDAERQALALMDHPNIAKVFDAGTTETAQPYFVMELVHGVPITEYCDTHRLTPRERLELFHPVCMAVQHAHQKGIIHRDLKPSNVLVAQYDGKPVPKVIDFGVAKATGPKLTEQTLYTGFGTVVGTLEYMSPEQAVQNQLDVDTRSDVYSLGVLLYELLTGTTPLDHKRAKKAALLELLRIIKEEEPPKPSTRLSTTDELPSIAANRGLDPKKLSLLVRGDLDWIVMKALEKDRARRYETANGLARDLDRYLRDEPVEACPPSALYRFRKFARRNRLVFTAATLVTIAVLLGTVGSTTQAIRATLAEKQTLAERDRAEASFRMARDAVDRLFTRVSQSPKLKARAMEQFRKDLLLQAKEFYERFIREQFDAPEVRYDLGLAHQRLGEIQRELGDYTAAEDSLTKAVATLSELVHALPDVSQYQRDLAASYSALGLVYSTTARGEKARTAYEEALALQEKQAAADPRAPEHRYELAKTYSALAFVENRFDQPERAATRCQQAQDILSRLIRDDPNRSEYQSLLAATQMNLGQVYVAKGLHDKAETVVKEAKNAYARLVQGRPDDLPDVWQSLARSQCVLGMVYCQKNQPANAEKEEKQALVIFEKLANEHPDVQEYVYGVGRCYSELARTAAQDNRPDAALARYDKSTEIMQSAVERGNLGARIILLANRVHRAGLLANKGDHTRAAEEAQAVARQGNLGALHFYDIACAFSLASAAADHDAHLSPAERLRLKTRYADQAMDFLRQAVDKGWRKPAAVKQDHDLDALRAREDFRKLGAQLEAKTPL